PVTRFVTKNSVKITKSPFKSESKRSQQGGLGDFDSEVLVGLKEKIGSLVGFGSMPLTALFIGIFHDGNPGADGIVPSIQDTFVCSCGDQACLFRDEAFINAMSNGPASDMESDAGSIQHTCEEIDSDEC